MKKLTKSSLGGHDVIAKIYYLKELIVMAIAAIPAATDAIIHTVVPAAKDTGPGGVLFSVGLNAGLLFFILWLLRKLRKGTLESKQQKRTIKNLKKSS